MSDSEAKLRQLHTRLENLAKYEAAFKREIADIRREILILKKAGNTDEVKASQTARKTPVEARDNSEKKAPRAKEKPNYQPPQKPPRRESRPDDRKPLFSDYPTNQSSSTVDDESAKSELEKFIGKYLISIIGILVTVIGVGIGTKYAIDNDWITPLMRIVFGYAVGLTLVGFAVHLKEKYHTYSSILISGGMAIMYFVTYFAFGFYEMISQSTAFALMVIFTVFTVLSSLIYNRQVIALIGLVGAYAVPFLLSEGSGRVDILFSYIAIINLGILALSLKKTWKFLFFASFAFTWIIFAGWYLSEYEYVNHIFYLSHFFLALTFLSIFFSIFYLTFLGYKLIDRESLSLETIPLIVLNSFAFFGFGIDILNVDGWAEFLGAFTLLNAFIHFGVAAFISRFRHDEILFNLLLVLVLTFFTITIPIEFDGNWVTVFWLAEGAFLFTVGRIRRIPLFEYLSYAVIALGTLSLVNDWFAAYTISASELVVPVKPFINPNFVTGLFASIAFAIIYFVDNDKRYAPQTDESVSELVHFLIPSALLLIFYNTFRIEIGNYFNVQSIASAVPGSDDYSGIEAYTLTDSSLKYLNVIWQINYSMFFLTVLSYLNIKRIRSTLLGMVNVGLNTVLSLFFITVGLFVLGVLLENYVHQLGANNFTRGSYHIVIRYISFGFLAALLFATYKYIQTKFIDAIFPSKYLKIGFELGLCFILLVILTGELYSWTEILKIDEALKLGLSVFWGGYALALIIVGIIQRKKHVRLFAIGLFAITLIKLFTYDIAELETIPKTIVFVLTGILLLISSFLYNKYTKIIFRDEPSEE